MAYLTLDEYRGLSLLPSAAIDDLDAQSPDWIANTIAAQSSVIDARLAKRYLVPFSDPCPAKVKEWLVRLLDARSYLKLGVDANDQQIEWIHADVAEVFKEMQEAADSQTGLWQLPLIQGQPGSNGIISPKVLSFSQASPYSWIKTQARKARNDK